jgi:hypothetical protein
MHFPSAGKGLRDSRDSTRSQRGVTSRGRGVRVLNFGLRWSRVEPLLTMEDSGFCYTASKELLLVRFPCNTASSRARRNLPRSALSLLEQP